MLSDRELVAHVVAGDAEAQALFVDRFSRFIWALLVRHLRVGPSASEELFQDVFVHLWADDCRRLRNWRAVRSSSQQRRRLWVRLWGTRTDECSPVQVGPPAGCCRMRAWVKNSSNGFRFVAIPRGVLIA